MSFEEFQDGHHGYRNGAILAILNLYVAPMPPIILRHNLTYGFWRRYRLNNFKMAAVAAILDIGTEQF